MIFLKSLLVGLGALVLAVVATAVTIVISLSIKGRNLPQGEGYGWDPVSLFRNSLLVWVVLALAFLIGFAWEYRRAMPHH